MSVTINIDTFRNDSWGRWDEAGTQKKAYLIMDPKENEENGWTLEVSTQRGGQENRPPNLIDRVNTLVKQQTPFTVKSREVFELLDSRDVTWEGSDTKTRKVIFEEYVKPRLTMFATQTKAGKSIDLNGMKNLIEWGPDLETISEEEFTGETAVPTMPVTGRTIALLLNREKTDEPTDLCSFAARGECAGQALIYLIGIVAAPFLAIYSGFSKDQWPHLGWRILDVTVTAIISPIIATIKTIQFLAGAIIHPAIALRSSVQEEMV